MKIRKHLGAVALATSALVFGSGCYGSFALTKKVYEMNQTLIPSKFGQSLLMWAFMIVPLYGVAVTIDVVILNLIEFWSGSNPLAQGEPRLLEVDGQTLQITLIEGGALQVATLVGGQATDVRIFGALDETGMVSVLDADGKLLATGQRDGLGLAINDARGEVVAQYDADEIMAAEALVNVKMDEADMPVEAYALAR